MTPRSTVSRQEWLERRRLLPQQEKQLTCVHDEVARARRALPWVRVDEPYRFEGPHGTCTLRDLFAGRAQLLVHHFMFDPEWTAGGLVCSFRADSFDGIGAHLAARGATLVAVSRAPYAALARYRQRMGWRFDWYSSAGSSINFDYGVFLYSRAGRFRGRIQRPAHASDRRAVRAQRPGSTCLRRGASPITPARRIRTGAMRATPPISTSTCYRSATTSTNKSDHLHSRQHVSLPVGLHP